MDGKAAEGEFTRDIAAEVDRLKQHKETKVKYMTLMMELKEQRREGYDEGRTEGITLSIQNLMSRKGWSIEDALDALGIPEQEWNSYKMAVKG